MLNDLRLGARLFLRRPGVALAAVLSLALGIGANSAIFSVLHAVVLNPLPYERPEELVIVWETSADNPERWVAPANFVDWRRETSSFASLAAFDEFRPTMTIEGGEPEVVRVVGVSGTFFPTLGVSAVHGRTLLAADDEAGAARVTVISHGLWLRVFGGAPDVLGRVLRLDGQPATIVGVMPAGFESPLQSSTIDLWVNGDRGVPRSFPFPGDVTAVRDSHLLTVVGRLAPGVTREAAQQELAGLMRELERRHPDTNAGLGVNVTSLHDQVVGGVRSLALLFQLAAGIMLAIACANVAHLLLGQAAGRFGEMSTRLALGARRSRLIRQLLAETSIVAVPGGLLGALVAVWGVEALVAARPQALPRVDEIGVDLTALAFTAAITAGAALVFGVGPAVHLARGASSRGAASTRVTGVRAIRRWHHGIVVGELAMAYVLLVGAALLATSLLAAERVPLGFEHEGRVSADLSLLPERYLRPVRSGTFTIDTTAKEQFIERVLARLRSAPGTLAAAASFTAPLAGAPNRGIAIEGRPPAAGPEPSADFQVVSTDYFRALGAALIRGRDFTDRDRRDTTPVAIANQAFVERYLGGDDPIGQRVRFGGSAVHEIVGVVEDMRYRSVEAAADPTFYLPLTQNAERWPFLSFTVWSDNDTSATSALLRTAIAESDPDQAVMRIRSYDEILSMAMASRRFNTTLVAVIAASAALLAAIGIFGVLSYAVAARTREIGLRAALGATPGDILRLVLRQGATLTAAALVIGVVGAAALTGVLRQLLFEVAPHDPRTFAIVSGALALVGLAATWLPARRALRVAPATALRDE